MYRLVHPLTSLLVTFSEYVTIEYLNIQLPAGKPQAFYRLLSGCRRPVFLQGHETAGVVVKLVFAVGGLADLSIAEETN